MLQEKLCYPSRTGLRRSGYPIVPKKQASRNFYIVHISGATKQQAAETHQKYLEDSDNFWKHHAYLGKYAVTGAFRLFKCWIAKLLLWPSLFVYVSEGFS
jgi:hypothetical protein